jgi:hypothetical protein
MRCCLWQYVNGLLVLREKKVPAQPSPPFLATDATTFTNIDRQNKNIPLCKLCCLWYYLTILLGLIKWEKQRKCNTAFYSEYVTHHCLGLIDNTGLTKRESISLAQVKSFCSLGNVIFQPMATIIWRQNFVNFHFLKMIFYCKRVLSAKLPITCYKCFAFGVFYTRVFRVFHSYSCRNLVHWERRR